jgi:hypothetical protein
MNDRWLRELQQEHFRLRKSIDRIGRLLDVGNDPVAL